LDPADRSIKLFAEAETLGGKRFVNDTLSVIIDVTGDQVCFVVGFSRRWLTPDYAVLACPCVEHPKSV
jgi:hypothetical protein